MNSKAKGANYERYIARTLGKWLYNDEEVFWRSAGSGSTKMKEHQGDIIAIKPIGKQFTNKYIIECKNVKKVDIFRFLNNEKDLMRKWIDQVEREIFNSHSIKNFLLIFHQHNSSNEFILISDKIQIEKQDFLLPYLIIHLSIGSYKILPFTPDVIKLLAQI